MKQASDALSVGCERDDSSTSSDCDALRTISRDTCEAPNDWYRRDTLSGDDAPTAAPSAPSTLPGLRELHGMNPITGARTWLLGQYDDTLRTLQAHGEGYFVNTPFKRCAGDGVHMDPLTCWSLVDNMVRITCMLHHSEALFPAHFVLPEDDWGGKVLKGYMFEGHARTEQLLGHVVLRFDAIHRQPILFRKHQSGKLHRSRLSAAMSVERWDRMGRGDLETTTSPNG